MKRRSMQHDAALSERLAQLAIPRPCWNYASVWVLWHDWDTWELY
jgi:hypothetical protein